MNKRKLTQVTGVILILFGLLGFISNPLFGLFQADLLNNIIHLATGGTALYLCMTMGEKGAILFGKVAAIIFGLFTLLGIITGSAIGIPGNADILTIDMILHGALTALFAYVGYIRK